MASEKAGSSTGSAPLLHCKNEQSIQGGLLFKSERVVVPSYLLRKYYNFCTHLISAWKVVFVDVESQFSDQE